MRTLLFLVLAFASVFWLSMASEKNDPAVRFLNSLDDGQRAQAVHDFNNNTREFWSYLPGAMMPRSGIFLYDLSSEQKDLAFELLRSSLSATGYEKSRQIISLESVLAEIDGNTEFRDPEKYSIAFYGDPAKDDIWCWSFEGHHLSLNFAHVQDEVAIAPRFMGASPATIMSGPRKGEKTLSKEAEIAMALIQSMRDEHRDEAIFRSEPYLDIVTGNGMEVSPLEPVGISYASLGEPQKALLLELINEYIATLPDHLAKARSEQIRDEE